MHNGILWEKKDNSQIFYQNFAHFLLFSESSYAVCTSITYKISLLMVVLFSDDLKWLDKTCNLYCVYKF